MIQQHTYGKKKLAVQKWASNIIFRYFSTEEKLFFNHIPGQLLMTCELAGGPERWRQENLLHFPPPPALQCNSGHHSFPLFPYSAFPMPA
jgi:hypothetical protein